MLGQNPNSQLIADDTQGEMEVTLKAMKVPEGDWDRPGVLEQSNVRPARRLTENVVEKRQSGR